MTVTPRSATTQIPGDRSCDRDLDPGFPWKRLTARVLQANMMFTGGWFVWVMLGAVIDSVDSYDPLDRFSDDFHDVTSWISDLAIDDTWVFAGLIIPGTVGGLAWYLIGRWWESKMMKQRQQAARLLNEGDRSPAKSANLALH